MKRLLSSLLCALLIMEAPGASAWAAAVRLRAPMAAPRVNLAAPVPRLSINAPTLAAPAPAITPALAVAPAVTAVVAPAVAPVAEPAIQAAARLAEPGAESQAPAYFDVSASKTDSVVAGAESSGSGALPPSGGGNGGGGSSEPPAPKGSRKLPRSLWGLFWGHHIFTVFGVNFHVLSQPFLVKDTLGLGTATMGLVRNIHRAPWLW